jgi:hypothetical protein
MLIEDGKGTGYKAEVDSQNRLRTAAKTVSDEHAANHDEGLAYQLAFSQSPDASLDCIAYILNSDDKDMVIEGIRVGIDGATAGDSMYFKLGDTGTRNSATALTPVNVNAGSGNTASGTFEKGANLNDGTLSGGVEFDRFWFGDSTDVFSANHNFEMDVVLPKNTALTIWIQGSGTGTYYITLPFYYSTPDF